MGNDTIKLTNVLQWGTFLELVPSGQLDGALYTIPQNKK